VRIIARIVAHCHGGKHKRQRKRQVRRWLACPVACLKAHRRPVAGVRVAGCHGKRWGDGERWRAPVRRQVRRQVRRRVCDRGPVRRRIEPSTSASDRAPVRRRIEPGRVCDRAQAPSVAGSSASTSPVAIAPLSPAASAIEPRPARLPIFTDAPWQAFGLAAVIASAIGKTPAGEPRCVAGCPASCAS
jgi:hypothetical protein